MEGIVIKNIKERAKEWGEHIIETTPYDVVDGKVCVFVEDRDIADVAEESYIAGATDQKAIDEEVRLKKSDDMTKAEYDREVAFADWYLKNGKGTPTYSDAIEWARKQTIDEVCNWLKNYMTFGTGEIVNNLLAQLHKAMEEELWKLF